MQNTTDRGGWPTEGPIDQVEHPKMDWQQRPLALYDILWGKGLIRGAETRRATESTDPELYESISYYDRLVVAIETLMVEKDILTKEEIDLKSVELKQRWG